MSPNLLGFFPFSLSPERPCKLGFYCTLIVATALRYGLTRNVEVTAEDTDVICLLVHHCTRANYNLYVSAKFGTYDIKMIGENLLPKQCEHLLFSHSFSGCDTVSSIYGFGKVKVLKKLCYDDAPEDVIVVFNNL